MMPVSIEVDERRQRRKEHFFRLSRISQRVIGEIRQRNAGESGNSPQHRAIRFNEISIERSEQSNESKKSRDSSRLGAEIAKGDTLTFLDAHVECSPGWLEYLLFEVKKDR